MVLILLLIIIQLDATDHSKFDNPALPVSVKPKSLDFGIQTIGYYTQKSILIHNLANQDIYIATDFNELDCFQPSLTRNNHIILSKGEQYELSVNFLPHETGHLSSFFSLLIFTVSSQTPGHVLEIREKGFAKDNPFHLTPFVGIRWPTYVAFTPLITIYNPYGHVLKVKEMYSSGGGLQLIPPFDVNEINTWYVEPYETKAIMRVNLFSEHAYVHSSYVTIRLDDEEGTSIKLPVIIDLVSSADVFPMPTKIDFGRFSRESPPKVVSISLLSTYNCSKKIFSISIKDSILHQNGISVKVIRDVLHHSQRGMFQTVAEVTITPRLLPEFADNIENHEHVGNISIKFGNSRVSDLDIPFTAYVYQGVLKLSGFGDGFYSGNILPRLYKKNMTLENKYDVPLAIRSMELKKFHDEFLIENLKLPFILHPKESFQFAKFSLKRQGQRFVKNLNLKIETNLTDFYYDVPIYNGDVDVNINGKPLKVLNFELLGYNQTRYKIVRLKNYNPVPIQLLYFFTNVPFCEGYYTELWRSDSSKVENYEKDDPIQNQLVVLGAGDYIDINVTIRTPSVPHNVSGFFVVETNIDFVQLPLTFRTLEGQLLTSSIVYDNIFPGQQNIFTLRITNTFNESVPLHSITFDDSSVIISNNVEISLKPLSTSNVGKIYFLPKQNPEFEYLLASDLKKQAEFFKGMHLNYDQVDYELKLYKHLKGKWNYLTSNKKERLQIKGYISTSYDEKSPIVLNLNLVWPTFVTNYTKFPVTHVKETSTAQLNLKNPSEHAVFMEVFFIHNYPHAPALVDILGMRNESVNLDSTFAVKGTSINWVEKVFTGSDIAGKVKTVVLGPKEETQVTIEFSPHFVGKHKSILVLRNNLTLFEPVLFSSTAAKGVLIFEKRSTLTMSAHENLFSQCRHAEESSIDPSYFNTNKTFTLRNAGDITTEVRDIQINGRSCEAHGIRIVNCNSFHLEPGEGKTIKINFVPNFHFIAMEYSLRVVPAAGDAYSVPLVTKIPSHMASICADKIIRPFWEAPLRLVCFTTITCSVIIGFIWSYLFFSTPYVTAIASSPPQQPTTPPTKPVKPEKAKKPKPEKVLVSLEKDPSVPKLTKRKSKESKINKTEKVVVDLAAKRKPNPVQITKSPYHNEVQASKPKFVKPAKMMSIVKPQPKEVCKQPLEKDINVVKPEIIPNLLSSQSKDIVDNKFGVPTPNPVATSSKFDKKLEQKFAKAVKEEQLRKTQIKTLLEVKNDPWTVNSDRLGQPGDVISNDFPYGMSSNSILDQVAAKLQCSSMKVDDWFAPDANNPFNLDNIVTSHRQQSRFQSLFDSSSSPNEDTDIWSPLYLDQQNSEIWKTD